MLTAAFNLNAIIFLKITGTCDADDVLKIFVEVTKYILYLKDISFPDCDNAAKSQIEDLLIFTIEPKKKPAISVLLQIIGVSLLN